MSENLVIAMIIGENMLHKSFDNLTETERKSVEQTAERICNNFEASKQETAKEILQKLELMQEACYRDEVILSKLKKEYGIDKEKL